MSPTEAIPLLIVVLLLVSIGGGDVQELSVTFGGDNSVGTAADVHVVAGGTTTVPPDASVNGDVYAIGGTTRIEGAVDGDVTLLAGNLSVADRAVVTGTIRTVGGEASIADGVTAGRIDEFVPPAPSSSPARRVGGFVGRFLALGALGWWFASRRPTLLETVGTAVADHALVSGVVGSLGATTLLVLFVYMAFTVVLLPVAIVGLLGELLVVLYGQIAIGYLVGTRLGLDRPTVGTVAGIGVVLLALEGASAVPYVGGVVQLAVSAVGFGAVMNTYFGLQRFEPVTIPGGTD